MVEIVDKRISYVVPWRRSAGEKTKINGKINAGHPYLHANSAVCIGFAFARFLRFRWVSLGFC